MNMLERFTPYELAILRIIAALLFIIYAREGGQ
jgi:hypothetical protein